MSALLSIGADAKTRKGEKKGYLTGILYLAPASEAGVGNLCPHASAGCRLACLYTAGMGGFESVKKARVEKTRLFKRDRVGFMEQISSEIIKLKAKAAKLGMIPCVRLNGTSDLPWHKLGIMEKHADVQFYDYTPNPTRALEYSQGKLPANYHLTFSRKEDNDLSVRAVAALGVNVAVVFKDKELPETWLGKRVVNGDESDLRFLDPAGVIVGLSAKGKGKKDTSGFVVSSARGYANYMKGTAK